jgi:hypothetical protein
LKDKVYQKSFKNESTHADHILSAMTDIPTPSVALYAEPMQMPDDVDAEASDDSGQFSEVDNWGPPIAADRPRTWVIDAHTFKTRAGYVGAIYPVNREGKRREPLYIVNCHYPEATQEFFMRHRTRTGHLPYYLHHGGV